MIVTELYNGSGLGNQLWRYIVTRAIAFNNGYKFGIMSPHKFKAPNIFNLDFGESITGGSGPEGGPPTQLPEGIKTYYQEKSLVHPVYKCDCRLYDPGLAKVPDNTKIEGNMESEKYLEGLKEEAREWIKVKDGRVPFLYDNVCVLSFRGGEYVGIPDLFLPSTYWQRAMQVMKERIPEVRFVVVTDDVNTASNMIPGVQVVHNSIEQDWLLVRAAKHIILSNSSFAWVPTWLNENVQNVIAPKYWGKHNVSDGFWAQGDSLTKGWEYIDREGNLQTYEECKVEKDKYELDHEEMYSEFWECC